MISNFFVWKNFWRAISKTCLSSFLHSLLQLLWSSRSPLFYLRALLYSGCFHCFLDEMEKSFSSKADHEISSLFMKIKIALLFYVGKYLVPSFIWLLVHFAPIKLFATTRENKTQNRKSEFLFHIWREGVKEVFIYTSEIQLRCECREYFFIFIKSKIFTFFIFSVFQFENNKVTKFKIFN